MLPIKKILCPTDFSGPANAAIITANELALHFSAEIILIHVVSTTPAVPASPAFTGVNDLQVLNEMENAAQETIAKDAERLLDNSLESHLMVINGNAADEIVRVAEEEKVDLIVISTHGLGGWREFFFGSVTEKVSKSASCPVLLIQPPNKEE